jgi:hypothetical protein
MIVFEKPNKDSVVEKSDSNQWRNYVLQELELQNLRIQELELTQKKNNAEIALLKVRSGVIGSITGGGVSAAFSFIMQVLRITP